MSCQIRQHQYDQESSIIWPQINCHGAEHQSQGMRSLFHCHSQLALFLIKHLCIIPPVIIFIEAVQENDRLTHSPRCGVLFLKDFHVTFA
jgi:hypothetical protein